MAAYVRLAPSTPVPMQALGGGKQKAVGALRLEPQRESGPAWSTLTTAQKEALYPLANRWNMLSEVQKRNWLHLAAGFHALSPEEQSKLLARITDWASLSAQQRSQARLNYATASQITRDDRHAQWEAYQALSAEEKKRLAATATPRPKGAATAVRPVAPKKLARIPAAANAPAAVPNPPKITVPADLHPLQALPVPAPAPAAAVETTPIRTPAATPAELPPMPDAQPQALPQTAPPYDPSLLYSPQ